MTQTIEKPPEVKTQLNAVKRYSQRYMPKSAYHNFTHAEDVAEAVKRIGYREGVSRDKVFLLETAAYLHDIVNQVGSDLNEEFSSRIAKKILPRLGYSDSETDLVSGLILATELKRQPISLLDGIMRDADVDNLGREDFFEKNESLRKELGVKDKSAWQRQTLTFLEKHKYYTETSRSERQYGLEKNVKKLKSLMGGKNGLETWNMGTA